MRNAPVKKKIGILFPDESISYTPSVTLLTEELSRVYSVEVICFDNGNHFMEDYYTDPRYQIIRTDCALLKPFYRYGLHKPIHLFILMLVLGEKKYDEIICVDSVALAAGTLLNKKVHFLSLEIKTDIYFRLSNLRKIASLLIQTEAREKFLFPKGHAGRTFYLPNAPVYATEFIKKKVNSDDTVRLIYFGSIRPEHGVLKVIEFMKTLNNRHRYQLTLKGTLQKAFRSQLMNSCSKLIKQGKLKIDSTYIKDEDVSRYLGQFHIGFCFYDFDLINQKNDYNYYTSPSGKVFNYYNAGVPVIGDNIQGLKSVSDFNAGILLDRVSPEGIGLAVGTILKNYDNHSANARKAAAFFDFRKAASFFKTFLNNA